MTAWLRGFTDLDFTVVLIELPADDRGDSIGAESLGRFRENVHYPLAWCREISTLKVDLRSSSAAQSVFCLNQVSHGPCLIVCSFY
jgi:hypothetical protein